MLSMRLSVSSPDASTSLEFRGIPTVMWALLIGNMRWARRNGFRPELRCGSPCTRSGCYSVQSPRLAVRSLLLRVPGMPAQPQCGRLP